MVTFIFNLEIITLRIIANVITKTNVIKLCDPISITKNTIADKIFLKSFSPILLKMKYKNIGSKAIRKLLVVAVHVVNRMYSGDIERSREDK